MSTGIVVACDPGLRGTGVAVFKDKKLIRAAYVKSPCEKERGPTAWYAMANAVRDWFVEPWTAQETPAPQVDVLCVEIPRIYPGPRKLDTDDLIQLAGVDGALSFAIPAAAWKGYYPRDWKGTVAKIVMTARIALRLSDAEDATIEPCAPSLKHNILDGVGIGLHYLGRL